MKKRVTQTTLALALTWDGARWPARSLPAKARAFLAPSAAPSTREMTKLLSSDCIKELRICWIPRLKGGPDVLSEPFPIKTRISFKATKTIPFGDILGVIYRRKPSRTKMP